MIIHAENPIIEVHDLTVSYNNKPVLWNVDFTLPAGQMIGIIGPNGAGKSTLLKSLMNLVPNSSGYIKLFNDDLDKVRHKISYVPQRESVDWDFPASVMDVALMGRYNPKNIFGRFSDEDKEIAADCLKRVNMLDYAKRQISQLSGGQQQRAFLARALAQKADLYLMDEPFAGVDASTEKAIIDLFLSMKQEGKTILVVHHDLQSAAEYFNWILLINTRLVASGPTDKIFTPEMLRETYGGKLTVLTKVGEIMKETQFPIREQ
ncbi:MAG: metal ABC transporter ATP-binding protein [Flavobacteriales bacterium]